MPGTTDRTLTEAQREQFLEQGYVVVPEAFPREIAEEWKARAWVRLGYDPHDPSTWQQGRIHMPALERMEIKEMAPEAWAVICELCGGKDRIKQPAAFGDSFIVNFHEGADRPWQEPSPQSPGWHKDGDFFRHFLNSPEQGLLVLVLWSDIAPRGGGTFAALDSVRPVAQFLAAHPEGVLPTQFDFRALVSQCRHFKEMTGRTGDVVLLNPFTLHASSQNPSGIPRFLTNPPISLNEPMQFDRANPEEFSLVERGVLRALGVERLPFQPTAPPERVVPERVRRQEKMKQEELARLAAAGAS